MKGVFYGVGIGPGDPELVTLKALRVLRGIQVVCAPRASRAKPSLALSVVNQLLESERPEVLELVVPMVKGSGASAALFEEGAREIYRRLREGKNVAYVTLGDPSLYSTFGYALSKLREIDPLVPVEIIPGITSFCAAAAVTEMPLAQGSEKLCVIPDIDEAGQAEQLASASDCSVFIKAAAYRRQLVPLLDRLGLSDTSILVSRCGLPGERVERDMRSLEAEPEYLSLVIARRRSG